MPPPPVKASPRWQGLGTTGNKLPDGTLEPGDPLRISCNHIQAGICVACAKELCRVLSDIPQLIDDLDIAVAKEAHFVEHGTFLGAMEDEDLGPSTNPALSAHARLILALRGDGTNAHPGVADWFDSRDPARMAHEFGAQLSHSLRLSGYFGALRLEPRMRRLAIDISGAAARAHRVIDTPADLVYYGPCPDCGRDIVQERIASDDDRTPVRCRFASCGYAAPLDVHQRRLLDGYEDRWMTVTELVSAITSGGEVVTRDQINGWIKRHGLAREKRSRPRYVNEELVFDEVWTYRLGDVRQRAAEAAERKRERAS